jgi:hypothetical protein
MATKTGAAPVKGPADEARHVDRRSERRADAKSQKVREHDRRSATGRRDTEKKMEAEKGSWGHEVTAQEHADELKEELKAEDAALDVEVPAAEEPAGEPEPEYKSLADFLNSKTKVTSHFAARSANEGSDMDFKGMAKLAKPQELGLFVELQAEKPKPKASNNNSKKAAAAAAPKIELAFNTGRREERRPEREERPRGPAPAGRGGFKSGNGAPAARGGFKSGSGASSSTKPRATPVNVADAKVFPSLS